MGRKTYEKVRTFGEWPFGSKPVVVLSSKKLKIPPKLVRSVSVMSGSVKDIVARLTERGIRHVYVDGGVTIQRFLEAGAIQRLIVTLIPVLIGQGIPLFGKLKRDIQLRHVATRQYDSGLVQSEYQVVA